MPLGKQHFEVAASLGNIGIVLQEQGKLDEASTHYQRALAIFEQAVGNKHPDFARTLGNIGNVLREQGNLKEALTHQQRALAIDEHALGKDHPDLAYSLIGLAGLALDQLELDTARTYAERAVSICEAGEVAPPLLAAARFALARALWDDRAERKRARALARQARDALAAEKGPGEADIDLAWSRPDDRRA